MRLDPRRRVDEVAHQFVVALARVGHGADPRELDRRRRGAPGRQRPTWRLRCVEVSQLRRGELVPLRRPQRAAADDLDGTCRILRSVLASLVAAFLLFVAVTIAAAIAEHLDNDDGGLIAGGRLWRCGCMGCGADDVSCGGQGTDVGRCRRRQANRHTAHIDVEGIENLQRKDVEIAGDADTGRTEVHGAVRRRQHHVALGRILAGHREQRANAGAGDEARRIDATVAVDIADQLQGRIGGRALRPLAGVEVAVGGEQLDVAALLGEDTALVDQHAGIGIGAHRSALQGQDALLVRRQGIGAVAADIGVAAGTEDIDVAAGLRLHQRARHPEVAGVAQRRHGAGATGTVVGVAQRRREQRGDRLVGAPVFAEIGARRILVVLADLCQQGMEATVDRELHRLLLLQQGQELRRRQVEREAAQPGPGRQRRELVIDGQRGQRREQLSGFGRSECDGDARIRDARRLRLIDDQLVGEPLELRDDAGDEVDAAGGRGRRVAIGGDRGAIIDAGGDAVTQGNVGALLPKIGLCRQQYGVAVGAVTNGEDAATKVAIRIVRDGGAVIGTERPEIAPGLDHEITRPVEAQADARGLACAPQHIGNEAGDDVAASDDTGDIAVGGVQAGKGDVEDVPSRPHPRLLQQRIGATVDILAGIDQHRHVVASVQRHGERGRLTAEHRLRQKVGNTEFRVADIGHRDANRGGSRTNPGGSEDGAAGDQAQLAGRGRIEIEAVVGGGAVPQRDIAGQGCDREIRCDEIVRERSSKRTAAGMREQRIAKADAAVIGLLQRIDGD